VISVVPFRKNYQKDAKTLILSILNKEFGHIRVPRPDLDNIAKTYQSNERSNFWIALDKRKIIGTVGLLEIDHPDAVLKRLCVIEKYRRRGAGKKLMQTLLQFAKDRGYSNIFLQTTTEMKIANSVYESYSFKKTRRPKKMGEITIYPTSIFYKLKL